jgi:uncharacterized protein
VHGQVLVITAHTSTPALIKFIPQFWYVRPFPVRLLSHSKFDNLSKMGSIHIPVLIVVGTADDATIPAMAQALFQKANEPKRLYLSPGAGHDDIWSFKTDELLAQITQFIQTLH